MTKQLFKVLVFALTIFTSCKKTTDINYNFPPKPEKNSGDNKLAKLFAENARKSEGFKIDATTGGTVVTNKGHKYTFPPNPFIFQNGDPVTGEVDLIIKEITLPSEMILTDKPTVTSQGRMLESFGEFKVVAFQDNTLLLLNQKAVINVAVPIARRDTLTNREIPMWDGDTIVKQTINGRDFENNPITLTKIYSLPKGMEWIQANDWAASSGSNLNFAINKLGNWRNADVLIAENNPTTLICYFTNVFNDSLSSNLLYFKVKGQNTLVKIYENIMEAPAGKSGFVSYQNRFSPGLQGTILGLVSKNGKTYAASKDITIGAPASGKTFYGVDLVLEEVTEAEILKLISDMDSK